MESFNLWLLQEYDYPTLKKDCLFNLVLTEVQTEQRFDRFIWGDKSISDWFLFNFYSKSQQCFDWLFQCYSSVFYVLEAVARRCSVKKLFLEISQNSHENTCARVSFWIKLDVFDLSLRPANFLWKRLWHRCFPVNFVKFLRTPFLTEYLRWLILIFELHQKGLMHP